MARPDRSFLQEVSKGPLPEGACDSQPLACESMYPAVFMAHRARIYSVTSSIHGLPCQQPPCKASTPAVTSLPQCRRGGQRRCRGSGKS